MGTDPIRPDSIYSEREASELLHLSRVSLWSLRKQKKIAHLPMAGRLIRYRGRQLIAYLASCERKGRARGART